MQHVAIQTFCSPMFSSCDSASAYSVEADFLTLLFSITRGKNDVQSRQEPPNGFDQDLPIARAFLTIASMQESHESLIGLCIQSLFTRCISIGPAKCLIHNHPKFPNCDSPFGDLAWQQVVSDQHLQGKGSPYVSDEISLITHVEC